MEKRITGFIFGIIAGFVGCIAAFVGLLSWLLKNNCEDIVASFLKWLKDSIHKLLWGTYPEARKPTYTGYERYTTPDYDYNKYSSSAIYTHRRRRDIMYIEFKSKEKAEKAKEKIIDTLNNFGKITIKDVLTILGSNEIEYLDSKFGWYETGCDRETIQVLSVPYNNVWYISMPYPVKIIYEEGEVKLHK